MVKTGLWDSRMWKTCWRQAAETVCRAAIFSGRADGVFFPRDRRPSNRRENPPAEDEAEGKPLQGKVGEKFCPNSDSHVRSEPKKKNRLADGVDSD